MNCNTTHYRANSSSVPGDPNKLASADLTAAFDIARRGGMKLFLADCWIEQAHQSLAASDLPAARTALDKAAGLIKATGYHKRDPDLALARAELALAEGNPAAAKPHLDIVVALMREHNLWSFLAPLERLAARYALIDLARTFPDLRAARARFDAEADAAFSQARGSPFVTPPEPPPAPPASPSTTPSPKRNGIISRLLDPFRRRT